MNMQETGKRMKRQEQPVQPGGKNGCGHENAGQLQGNGREGELRMGKEKTYREYIYKNYAGSLRASLLTGSLARERKLIHKYFIKNYLPFFPADKTCRVLDLGCGLGNYMHAAKKCGYGNVTGVDTSASAAAFCRKSGLSCMQSDAGSFLKAHEDSYDVILFNDIIEHFDKDEAFEMLLLLRRALKGGGRVIIKTMNLSNPITGQAGLYFDFTHETGFTEVSLRQVLLAASFKKVRITGADIYVSPKPFIYILKIFAEVSNAAWYLLNCLYGRTTVRLFEKNLIAAAYKE